jgi:hypothetical protein
MAKIIHLSDVRTDKSTLFGVKRALTTCACSPLYLVLAALLPVAIIVCGLIYLPFACIHRITGSYPFSMCLLIGDAVSSDSAA